MFDRIIYSTLVFATLVFWKMAGRATLEAKNTTHATLTSELDRISKRKSCSILEDGFSLDHVVCLQPMFSFCNIRV